MEGRDNLLRDEDYPGRFARDAPDVQLWLAVVRRRVCNTQSTQFLGPQPSVKQDEYGDLVDHGPDSSIASGLVAVLADVGEESVHLHLGKA